MRDRFAIAIDATAGSSPSAAQRGDRVRGGFCPHPELRSRATPVLDVSL